MYFCRILYIVSKNAAFNPHFSFFEQLCEKPTD